MQTRKDVRHCANGQCQAKFQKLGEGRTVVFPVSDSLAWGLPKDVKLKTVWLCDGCSKELYVQLDRVRHQIKIIHRHSSNMASL